MRSLVSDPEQSKLFFLHNSLVLSSLNTRLNDDIARLYMKSNVNLASRLFFLQDL